MTAAALEVGPNIVAVVVLIIPTITVALNAWILHKSNQIHGEVKTINGQRLGELADNAETRRIDELAPADRSIAERAHLTAATTTPTPGIAPEDIRDRPLGG